MSRAAWALAEKRWPGLTEFLGSALGSETTDHEQLALVQCFDALVSLLEPPSLTLGPPADRNQTVWAALLTEGVRKCGSAEAFAASLLAQGEA